VARACRLRYRDDHAAQRVGCDSFPGGVDYRSRESRGGKHRRKPLGVGTHALADTKHLDRGAREVDDVEALDDYLGVGRRALQIPEALAAGSPR